MPTVKTPREMTTIVGVPGESLISNYDGEERRIDYLTLQDYRSMVDNDGQVQMLVNAINNTILASGVEIVDPSNYEGLEDSEEKLFIESNLFNSSHDGGMAKSLELTNRIMLRAFIEGYRVFEVVYKLGDDKKIHLDRLASRAGINDHELYLIADDKGDFVGIRQRTAFKNRIVDVTIRNETSISKVVKATFGEEYGSLYGRSGLKAAWYHYDKAHKGMFLNHVGHELGTQKVRYIRHKSASDEMVVSAITAASKFTSEAVIAMDENVMTIETLELSSADVMRAGQDGIDKHYSLMVKSVLAQFIDLGTTETGSRSLGDSQIKFFKQGLEAVARIILEETWNKVIADLCRVNFGRGIYPKLKVKPISDNKTELLHVLFTEMIKKGVINTAITERIQERVSDDLGLDVSEEDMLKSKDESDTAQDLIAKVSPQQEIAPKIGQEDSKVETDTAELYNNVNLEDQMITPEEAIRESRALFADEQKVNWSDIRYELENAQRETLNILSRKLAVQKQDIINKYVQAIREGRKSINSVKISLAENSGEADYSLALLTQVLKLMEFGKISAANELLESVPTTKTPQRVYMEDKVNATVGEQQDRLKLRLTSVANAALINNIPENQAQLLLDREYDNFFEVALKPTVAALLPEALNWGRKVTFDKYNDVIFAYRYSAVLDNRTTEYCSNLDGKVFQITDPDFYMVTPPNHFGCRSIWVAILKRESAGVKVDGKPFGVPVYGSISSFKNSGNVRDATLSELIEKIINE